MPKTDPNSANVTFAFSEKQDAWTTRYSFVPTCYANCSDEMLSFKDGLPKAWLHDMGSQRNVFYNENLAPSSVELSFNDTPSAVKVFKSISLETNGDLWRAGFSTNSEYEDENNQNSVTEIQELTDKEGFKYFEVPRSVSNSTANVVPAPSVLYTDGGQQQIQSQIADALGEFLEAGSTYLISIDLPLDETSYSSFLSTPFGDGVEFVGFFDNAASSTPLPTGMYTFGNFLTYFVGTGYYDFGSLFPLGSNITISNIQNGVMTITFNSPITLLSSSGFNTDQYIGLWFLALQDFLLNATAFFANSPAIVNGDQMRGPYLNTTLNCFSDKPVELHSVNVDYEFSSSAARLTQNS